MSWERAKAFPAFFLFNLQARVSKARHSGSAWTLTRLRTFLCETGRGTAGRTTLCLYVALRKSNLRLSRPRKHQSSQRSELTYAGSETYSSVGVPESHQSIEFPSEDGCFSALKSFL